MSDVQPMGICPPIIEIIPGGGHIKNHEPIHLRIVIGKASNGTVTASISTSVITLPTTMAFAAAPGVAPTIHSPKAIVEQPVMSVPFPVGATQAQVTLSVNNTTGQQAQLIVTATTITPPAVTGVFIVDP